MGVVTEVARIVLEHNKADVSEEMLINDAEDLVEFEKQLYLVLIQNFNNNINCLF